MTAIDTAAIEAKTRKELATVKVKGFIGLYETTLSLIHEDYISDMMGGLERTIGFTLDPLRDCDPDALVPENLHGMCIATDILIEQYIHAPRNSF